jgi:hypothetical protein
MDVLGTHMAAFWFHAKSGCDTDPRVGGLE